MAKVVSYTVEDQTVYMTNPDIEFVSLVQHAANQFPIKITKGEVENMPEKVLYSVLVPKNTSTKKLQELAEEHGISLDKENKSTKELEGCNVFRQVDDEQVDLESKSLTALDRENGIYGVVADLKEDSEEHTPVDKEAMSWETLDDVADGLMAMVDVIMGTLRQPEATDANRRNTVLTAVDNFRKYAEAVLSNSKSEDVADVSKLEVGYENLKDLLVEVKQQEEEPEQSMKQEDFEQVQKALDEHSEAVLEKANQAIEEKAEEKSQAVRDEINQSLEEMDKNLQEKFDTVAEKETVEELAETVKELKQNVEELMTTAKRKSDVSEGDDDDYKSKKKQTEKRTHQPGRFVTVTR